MRDWINVLQNASVSTNFYAWGSTSSGLNLGAILVLAVMGTFFMMLTSLGIFRKFAKAFGYIGKVGLHVLEGAGVYLGGKAIYDATTAIQEYHLITWELLITWTKWGAGLTILGFIAHKAALRIYDNYSTLWDNLAKEDKI